VFFSIPVTVYRVTLSLHKGVTIHVYDTFTTIMTIPMEELISVKYMHINTKVSHYCFTSSSVFVRHTDYFYTGYNEYKHSIDNFPADCNCDSISINMERWRICNK